MKTFEEWWKINMPKDSRYESAYHKALLKDGWQAAMEEVGILAHDTPPDPQRGHEQSWPGRKPWENIKPLAQYLGEYLATGIDRTHEAGMPVDFTEEGLKSILEQALDAYESTEGVKVRIEKV